MRMYFMNCGVFHSFIEELLGLKARVPQLLSEVDPLFSTFEIMRSVMT